MKQVKIWLYGVRNDTVVMTAWYFNDVSDEHLEAVAAYWKDPIFGYGCDKVYAMMESKALRNAWYDYIRAVHRKDGTADFAKFEFLDYLKSGDMELAAA